MAIKSKKTIPYHFSEKHMGYIRRCRDCTYNIAEGAVRAGKTVDNVIAFCKELRDTPDKLHLATASTAATAKLIIGDCNRFGVEHYFRNQCKWGKYKGNEALIICGKFTHYKTKIVMFVGGGKSNSYKKFRGSSIGMWIATEIDLHHEDTIDEAFKRQAAAKHRKIFWDLNPGSPFAVIYKKYIDEFAKKPRRELSVQGITMNIYIPMTDKARRLVEIIFPTAPPDERLWEFLLWFYKCGREPPKIKSNSSMAKKQTAVYSFEYDDGYIFAAFMEVYGVDLVDVPYLHWWKFKAMFRALHDCKITDIMGYRYEDIKKAPEYRKKFVEDMKRLYALPRSLSERQKMQMKSFIPWIGGKSQLVKKITAEFPEKFGRYIEVFGGGASVLFSSEKHAKSRYTTTLTATLLTYSAALSTTGRNCKKKFGTI